MDDTMLAFMVFAASHPKVLAQVRALTEAEALEAGEALPDLRETMAVQILSAEAKAQRKTLDKLVEMILDKAVIEPDAPTNANGSSLEKYNRMRDFDASPEPSGIRKQSTRTIQALQFCVQKHDATRLHYDFRLELDGTLKSWAIPKGPCLDPKVKRLSVHVEDHPLDYASFEGTIPEGHYGAGDVIVWDRGIWLPQGDPAEAYKKGRLKFQLQGRSCPACGAWFEPTSRVSRSSGSSSSIRTSRLKRWLTSM